MKKKRADRWRSISALARLPALLAGAVALLAGPPAVAASSASADEMSPPQGFSETVEVRVINVEAVVTDRSGQRIYGLTPDDFRVEVDGREIPIDFFSEIRGGELIVQKGRENLALPGVAPGDPVRTNYLVFVDDFFAVQRDRDRVLQAIEDQIDRLRDVDRMAILAFDGSRTSVLANWTNDRQALRRALDQASSRDAQGLERYAELRTSDEEREFLDRSFTRFWDFDLTPLERQYAGRLEGQLERSVKAAELALQGFGAPPGRKVALLLTGGWPFSPAEYTVDAYYATFEDVQRGVMDISLRGRAELYGDLSDVANLLGYTLYPVDVPGLDPMTNDDPSAARGLPQKRFSAFDREEQTERTLRFLAQETGGEALINARRDDALTAAVQDTRSYYWLGFSARRFDDGERYDIDVEAKPKGLRVRTREDFVDLSRSDELDAMVRSALMFGNPVGGSGLELRLGETKGSGDVVKLPIEVGIPMDEVFLESRDGRHLGRLVVRLAAIGPEGNLSKVQARDVDINEDGAPEAGQKWWLDTELELRTNTDRIAVMVYDEMSGEILARVATLDLESS